MKPVQAKRVLMVMEDGSVQEGHYLKNANKYEQNINRWRIYKTGRTVEDKQVVAWVYMDDLQKALLNEQVQEAVKLTYNIDI